jgi:hypothetical protein
MKHTFITGLINTDLVSMILSWHSKSALAQVTYSLHQWIKSTLAYYSRPDKHICLRITFPF